MHTNTVSHTNSQQFTPPAAITEAYQYTSFHQAELNFFLALYSGLLAYLHLTPTSIQELHSGLAAAGVTNPQQCTAQGTATQTYSLLRKVIHSFYCVVSYSLTQIAPGGSFASIGVSTHTNTPINGGVQ